MAAPNPPDLLDLAAYDYDLPPEQIATYPLAQRDQSKMMVVNRAEQTITHHRFFDLPNLLNTGDLLVMNNTQVLPCRVFGQRENQETGDLHTGKIECFFLQPRQQVFSETNEGWEALVKPARKLPVGARIHCHGAIVVVLEHLGQGKVLVDVQLPNEVTNVVDWLTQAGSMPIPPYLGRAATETDNTTYQTVFAKPHQALGQSQAAPTAGLHMTPDVLSALNTKEINQTECTLRVSTGTFREVTHTDITQHQMDAEHYDCPQSTADSVNSAKANGGKVIAMGTTAAKTLETAYRQTAAHHNNQLGAHQGWSELFIYPGVDFHIVDGLITNFHLPKSTLMMLVSAFAGYELIMDAYQQAIANDYRFYSYGDCMLIL